MLDKNIDPARTFDEKTFEWLRKLCHQTKTAVEHRHAKLKTLKAQLALIRGKTCTGWVIWRDSKQEHAAKMIIHHSIGQACPLHGQPGPGKRLRSYIGTDPCKQTRADKAIEDEEKRAKLQRAYNELASKLHTAGYALCEFYRALDYPTPKFGGTDRKSTEISKGEN